MKLKPNGLPVGIQYGWWWSSPSNTMKYDRLGEPVSEGQVTTVEGRIQVCANGLHASNLSNPLAYPFSYNVRQDATIYLVGIWGDKDSKFPYDWKFCGRHRLYIKGLLPTELLYKLIHKISKKEVMIKLKEKGFPIYQTILGKWKVDEDKVPRTLEEIAA